VSESCSGTRTCRWRTRVRHRHGPVETEQAGRRAGCRAGGRREDGGAEESCEAGVHYEIPMPYPKRAPSRSSRSACYSRPVVPHEPNDRAPLRSSTPDSSRVCPKPAAIGSGRARFGGFHWIGSPGFGWPNPELGITLRRRRAANPVILAAMYYDPAILSRAMGSGLRAVTRQSPSRLGPRPGHPQPNLVRTRSDAGPGLVNCNGFQNPGLEGFRASLARYATASRSSERRGRVDRRLR